MIHQLKEQGGQDTKMEGLDEILQAGITDDNQQMNTELPITSYLRRSTTLLPGYMPLFFDYSSDEPDFLEDREPFDTPLRVPI